MKKPFVEVQRVAVVAQVQTYDPKIIHPETGRDRQDIGRVATAFPAMNQHSRAPALVQRCCVLQQQANTIAAFHDPVFRRSPEPGAFPEDASAAHEARRQDRLNMPAAQAAWCRKH